MFLAIIAPLLLPSFPEKAKWLKPRQKIYLFQKLQRDHGQYETEKVGPRTVLHVSKDGLLWLQGSIYMFCVGTANATAFFAPTIITVSFGASSLYLFFVLVMGGGGGGGGDVQRCVRVSGESPPIGEQKRRDWFEKEMIHSTFSTW